MLISHGPLSQRPTFKTSSFKRSITIVVLEVPPAHMGAYESMVPSVTTPCSQELVLGIEVRVQKDGHASACSWTQGLLRLTYA
ncbi:hypothetical protein Hypma_003123 [Hypsizygus marmoreus]|uniref:Uncharacterized protein n=1 Tax=Hypsizygus marmoreus TaxID=39966 RepID=A0A369J2G5_HYPMA|nr:hypothetical protein Hypma_003123 [Hypsizygus marmoreus]